MPQTVVEKVAQSHLSRGPTGRAVRAGDFVSIRPAHVLTHDNTAPVMAKFASLGATRVADPSQPVFVLDHDIQNRSEENLSKYRAIEEFAHQHDIDFYAAGNGIGHQIVCERLYARPGAFVVASDSHANTYGALGAIGTPVVRTDAAAIWATGEFWWQIPETVQVVLSGTLRRGVSGKDVILALCGRFDRGEVLNRAVEFAGEGTAGLSIEQRMTIANMTTEWGALTGWFPFDARTRDYIRDRLHTGVGRATDAMQVESLEPDENAFHVARITLDLSTVTPVVAGPDTVQATRPLAELERERIPVDKAYLVSCVNSRLGDLQSAAAALRGHKVAPGVEFYVAAASREVQQDAERSGAWQALVEAGAHPLAPGCGPCIGLGAGLLKEGEVAISATNRNFKGRMGSPDARCYLASPAVVAASAVAGYLRGPEPVETLDLTATFEEFEQPAAEAERVEILDGFPRALSGRLIYLPADNLNTDGIYGKEYTYRDQMSRDAMATVVMRNYDPGFAALARDGDIVVAGRNFGTGSSREQAVTALQARGIRLVIAASVSQTYLRNAFNNGFVCIACPQLVNRLRNALGPGADDTTILPGDEITVDFAASTVGWRGETLRFPPLGSVPQELVAAGGVENLAKQRLRSHRTDTGEQ